MKTEFKHITEIAPSEIILKRDGTIILNKAGEKKQVIGSWEVIYPKKEAKKKGLIASEFVDTIYNGGIPYKGNPFGYTRTEFIEHICHIAKTQGIDIKK